MDMEESWRRVDDAAIGLTEMKHLRRKQENEDAANSPCMGRQVLLPSSPMPTTDAAAHIKLGSYYEIDHSKLSQRTPDQLKSVRIVMVNNKSKYSVSLRFPSMHSLRAHFRERSRQKPEGTMLPALDEKHVMESELAGDVLYRRIPPHEIAVKRNVWSFWVVAPPNMDDHKEKISSAASNTRLCCVVSKKGSCWSELSSTGMVKWGQRRRVRYLSRHLGEKELEHVQQILSSTVKGEEEETGKENKAEEEDEEEEEEVKETEGSDDYEESMKEDDQSRGSTKRNTRKRKSYGSNQSTQKAKRAEREKLCQITGYKQNTKTKVHKSFIDRWSVERYKLAEKNMLKVLKEKGAVFGNPILRPALRAEARKWIGDTGLLDHLLKHMAGKVAPGGKERFRRRHNADGAMEYWLESADLVNIRKDAGVQDPYWTPPPGWKPGDNPTQDPVCAKEIKELREEIVKLKRSLMEERTSRKQEDLAIVTMPTSSVTSQNLDHGSILLPLKEIYMNLMHKKAEIDDQLVKVSRSLCGMEVDLGRLRSTAEEWGTSRSGSVQIPLLLMGSTSTPSLVTERDMRETAEHNKESGSRKDQEKNKVRGKTILPPPPPPPPLPPSPPPPPPPPTVENKAAKIERLKSGFRICKPHGTFLWPNMAISPHHVVVPLDDMLAVHTPPSVTSSTTSSAPFIHSPTQQVVPHLVSPVKPLAEKRPVFVSLPTAITTSLPPPYGNNSPSSINLNEFPINQSDSGNYWSHNHCNRNTSATALTYQRRYQGQNVLPLAYPKKEGEEWEEGETRKETLKNFEQQQQRGCTSSSCFTVEVGTWLALASPNSSGDDNSDRG